MRSTVRAVVASALFVAVAACGGDPSYRVTAEDVDVDLVDAPADDGVDVVDDPDGDDPTDPVDPGPDPVDPIDPDPVDPDPADPDPVDPVDPVDPDDPPASTPCPADVTCIDLLPFFVEDTTASGTDRFDSYACAPTTNEAGPERIYRVTLPSTGRLTVRLDSALETGGVDVDVHILTALDPATCRARGHLEASAVLPAGEAFVVFDSFTRRDGSDGRGAFAADVAFFPFADDNVLTTAGVDPEVATLALRAFDNAAAQDLADRPVLTVIDFSLPSTERRLWTVDLQRGVVLFHDRVTHGIGSNSDDDPAMASRFSNIEGSLMSSLGLSRTAETYQGSNGYSLRLDGLEPDNDAMRERFIVVHGATYAEDDFVDDNGFLGRSEGCPAVAMSRSATLIDLIKEGTLIFSYFPDEAFLARSPFLVE